MSTTEYTSFDILGRVTGHKQTTDGTDYTTAYSYKLSGALDEETYPSTRVVKNVLDQKGDLAMVESKKNSSAGYWSYANSFAYNPAGAITSMQLGNGHWESTRFNARLQPTEIYLGTTPGGYDKLKLNYSYGDWVSSSIDTTKNNGNIVQQVIVAPGGSGFTATHKYYYDELNRIDDATETISSQTWRQDFAYDRYGNRTFVEANTTTLPKLCSSNTVVCASDRKKLNPAIVPNTNKLVLDQDSDSSNDYAFDSSGNTTADALGRTFVYDAENKQISVSDSGGYIGQYSYDGNGKRIKKRAYSSHVLTEETTFVYDAMGKLMGEYTQNIASSIDAKVAYLTNDHIRSPRINTDANGTVISRHDYHPFGEVITAGRGSNGEYSPDMVRKQFTGYERDTETGMDFAQARYRMIELGRFSSPDAHDNDTVTVDPQSWNLYAYVRNNPIKYLDGTGKTLVIVINGNSYNVVRVATGFKLENNDGSNRLVTAAQAMLDRATAAYANQIGTLVGGTPGAPVSTINIDDQSAQVNSPTAAIYNADNTVSSTTVTIGINGSDDESFVAFATELLVANELVSHPNPFAQHSQANSERGEMMVSQRSDDLVMGEFDRRHYEIETGVREDYDLNPQPMSFSRYTQHFATEPTSFPTGFERTGGSGKGGLGSGGSEDKPVLEEDTPPPPP